MTVEERKRIGSEAFKSGENCSQATVGAFADLLGDGADTLKLAAVGFGGGMGRLREVCGAVTGAYIVLGALLGDKMSKAEIYSLVQDYAQRFKQKNGSIICAELLGLPRSAEHPTPEPRTTDYYKKRPCALLVEDSVEILCEILLPKLEKA